MCPFTPFNVYVFPLWEAASKVFSHIVAAENIECACFHKAAHKVDNLSTIVKCCSGHIFTNFSALELNHQQGGQNPSGQGFS
jgi:hypothetical protein